GATVGNAGRARTERIAESCRAVDLHRVRRHLPALAAAELDAMWPGPCRPFRRRTVAAMRSLFRVRRFDTVLAQPRLRAVAQRALFARGQQFDPVFGS